jgi:hypothetical protein
MSMARKPPLDVWEILDWADAHFARTGNWPNDASGRVYEYPQEKWLNISKSLARGSRGLPGGSTLAQLLEQFRGVRNLANLPRLGEEQILTWADAHFDRTGDWPTFYSGLVPETRGESWSAIDCALHMGIRGLAGGTSLVRLLREQRGVVPAHSRPQRQVAGGSRTDGTRPSSNGAIAIQAQSDDSRSNDSPPEAEPYQLDYFLILQWADAYFARHGVWPNTQSGGIEGTFDETWSKVNTALRRGLRGLAAGSSLARLLAEKRGVRKGVWGPLTIENILQWADAHRERTGEWPTVASGALVENPHDNWLQIHEALSRGQRGLLGGSSLSKLLDQHRGTRRALYSRPLSEDTILEWADAYFARHGKWPTRRSGPLKNRTAISGRTSTKRFVSAFADCVAEFLYWSCWSIAAVRGDAIVRPP